MSAEKQEVEALAMMKKLVSNQTAMRANPQFTGVVKATKMTSEDVLIAGFMKTGTNMMQQVCHQIRMGGIGDEDFDEISNLVPILSVMSVMIKRDLNERQRGGFQIFKTHDRPHLLPDTSSCRVILVLRDPVNSFASGLQWAPGVLNINTDGLTPVDGYRLIFRNEEADCNMHYWKFAADWLRQFKTSSTNILPVCYETLVKDPAAVIGRIARFMGKQLNDEQINKVVELSSFEYMKANDDKFSLRRQREKIQRAAAARDGVEYKPIKVPPFLNKGAAREGRKELPEEVVADMELQWTKWIEPEFGYHTYGHMREELDKNLFKSES